MNATHDDIHRLLRSFGMQADEVMQAHVKNAQGAPVLKFRLVLEDITDYGGTQQDDPPRIYELEGEVHV